MRNLTGAINLIKQFEGLSLEPYLDTGGVATIGYGSTHDLEGNPITMQDDKITEQTAEDYLEADLTNKYNCISGSITQNLNDNQLDAILSLVYNVGVEAFLKSSCLKQLNLGNFGSFEGINEIATPPTMANQWGSNALGFNKVNGEVVEGLVNRRETELKIFFS